VALFFWGKAMTTTTVKTTCPYCGVGCGVDAKVENNQLIAVSGNKQHPANAGRLCVKGSALHETVSHDGRMLYPSIAGQRVAWDDATRYVADNLSRIIQEHGPDSVAMYVSGQILTEDYYVANKLMKGFIGTSNIDTNSRLCMASAVVAHKRAFGTDTVPGCYEDIELADLVILTGSNLAWAHPIVYQRLAKAKSKRPEMKVVVIDPRRTATCDIADLHLSLKPGSDAFLFNGLAHHILSNQLEDRTFIDNHCNNFAELAKSLACQTLANTAVDCDLTTTELANFYQLFTERPRTVTLFSQGINQSSSGVDKGNSILNCHLLTGRIGKPGAAPFSMTGQPNAMGGREVGGLANQLAAHMDFKNPTHIERVARFWQASNMATGEGLKAVDMFNAVNEGKIKAIWIMATNPVVSMPDADNVKRALEKCELVIVSDSSQVTDTTQFADVLLPATTWAEKDGTVTNSERFISRQTGFLTPPGEAKNDWVAICDIAKKMGFEGFDYTNPAAIFREHARLSGFENDHERDFDISGLSEISDAHYQTLEPIQWPVSAEYPNGRQRFFDDGYFYTPNHKANLVVVEPRLPAFKPNEQELILNTGRIRDQWHTMTRTGKAHRLLEHIATPLAEIHPKTAKKLNISERSLVRIKDRDIDYIARAQISDAQREDSVFVPMHWTESFASKGRANALVRSIKDQLSGQPEFKHSPVVVSALNAQWQGVLITALPFTPSQEIEWFKVPLEHATLWELIKLTDSIAPSWIEDSFPDIEEWVVLSDSSQRFLSAAGFIENKLSLVLMSGPDLPLFDKKWLSEQIGKTIENKGERLRLLSGVPADPASQTGRTVCSCFQVGEQTIINCLSKGEASSVEALGTQLKCGTNCGSCIPELRQMVQQYIPAKETAA
jgi:assimilatory nitrate reductase catalytic subunit